jgi:hypothetical protein
MARTAQTADRMAVVIHEKGPTIADECRHSQRLALRLSAPGLLDLACGDCGTVLWSDITTEELLSARSLQVLPQGANAQ